jgi:MFS family permease
MASISLRLLVTVALNTHFVPLLVWRGMSEGTSAYLVSLSAFISILASLTLGWLGDRWNKTLLSSVCIIPSILALTWLMFSQGTAALYFFPIGYAITLGTVPLNWALIGDFFGRRSYATLRGIMGLGYGTATFFSPIYAGWIFDRTESYTMVLLTFSIILLVTTVFFAVLRRPTPPRAKKELILT